MTSTHNTVRRIKLMLKIGLICLVITSAMHYMYKNQFSKLQMFLSQQQAESTEYRDLFAQYAALNQIDIPVGTWESSNKNDHTNYLLKINSEGGFVLSINTYQEQDKKAMTGVFKIKGSTFIAEHVVGSGKTMIPKNGHLIVKCFSGEEIQIIEPKTLDIINLKLI